MSRPGVDLIKSGGLLAALGAAIVLWPERGLRPHPLPFPPSEATGHPSAIAIFGYPLLALGVILLVAGALRVAINQAASAPARRAAQCRRDTFPQLVTGDVPQTYCEGDVRRADGTISLRACARRPGHTGPCSE